MWVGMLRRMVTLSLVEEGNEGRGEEGDCPRIHPFGDGQVN